MFTRPLPLPTLATKNDARANQNDNSKVSVADSLVLLQSLKQSRNQWLTKSFLRFSTLSKEKADQVYPAPPPHSLSLAGICDVEIGPHLFPKTGIFFVQYRYGQPPAPAPPAPTPAPTPVPAPAPAPTTATHTAPITVSHELHAKVLAAAAKDADLNYILKLASEGRANVTQLRTLGATIKLIEAGTYPGVAPPTKPTPASASGSHTASPNVQARPASVPQSSQTPASAPVPSAAAVSTPAPAPIPTPSAHAAAPTQPQPQPRAPVAPAIPTTAVLLEFSERPIDRWLLPTEYVLLDRRSNGDVNLSTFYPFDAYVPSGSAMRSKPAHPITIRFMSASTEIWNALLRTCTTVSPASVQGILAEVVSNVPSRTYLQYRVAPGAMWEDLKMASQPVRANPNAQAFLLPSTPPAPVVARTRRTDAPGGENPPKRRKANAGDGTGASTPRESNKPKGKGKEKEVISGDTSGKPPASASQAILTTVPVATQVTPNQTAGTNDLALRTATPVSTSVPTSHPSHRDHTISAPPDSLSTHLMTTGVGSVNSASRTPTAVHPPPRPNNSKSTGTVPNTSSIGPTVPHPAQVPSPGASDTTFIPQAPVAQPSVISPRPRVDVEQGSSSVQEQ